MPKFRLNFGAIIFAFMATATEAFGFRTCDIFEQPLLTKRFLDQWVIFCHTAFLHIPTPQITSSFANFCDSGGGLIQSAAQKPIIRHKEVLLKDWFFVPYEPQWIKTAPLIEALYNPKGGIDTKYRVIRNLGKMASSLVSYHWYIDIQETSPHSKDLYRTQVWAAQLAPYSRDNYILIEALVKRLGALADLKRVIGILPAEGGGVVVHYLMLTFGADPLSRATIEAQARQFATQNKNLRELIFRDLGTQFQLSPFKL